MPVLWNGQHVAKGHCEAHNYQTPGKTGSVWEREIMIGVRYARYSLMAILTILLQVMSLKIALDLASHMKLRHTFEISEYAVTLV